MAVKFSVQCHVVILPAKSLACFSESMCEYLDISPTEEDAFGCYCFAFGLASIPPTSVISTWGWVLRKGKGSCPSVLWELRYWEKEEGKGERKREVTLCYGLGMRFFMPRLAVLENPRCLVVSKLIDGTCVYQSHSSLPEFRVELELFMHLFN